MTAASRALISALCSASAPSTVVAAIRPPASWMPISDAPWPPDVEASVASAALASSAVWVAVEIGSAAGVV